MQETMLDLFSDMIGESDSVTKTMEKSADPTTESCVDVSTILGGDSTFDVFVDDVNLGTGIAIDFEAGELSDKADRDGGHHQELGDHLDAFDKVLERAASGGLQEGF